MYALQQIATVLLMLLVLTQSTIFVWQPARGGAMWRTYLDAWKQTFTLAKKALPFLFAVRSRKDALLAMFVVAWVALCMPGIFIVRHALNLMK
ncbi:hypothetical protein ACEN2Y_00465 (plasmid) [Ralstonia solanacearum]|uniref:hypothetical protein n=1 Tax=Ralstonia solanacearum TaxID=305 RepID=UPI003216701A